MYADFVLLENKVLQTLPPIAAALHGMHVAAMTHALLVAPTAGSELCKRSCPQQDHHFSVL